VGLTRRVALVALALTLLVVANHVSRVPSAPTVPVVAEESLADGRTALLAEHHDVVVYGGTPAGVAAALAATRHSADVTLVVAGSTVGGMMSNGLSASDIGSPLAVHGVMLGFFERVRAHYDDPGTWRFEPHVAEQVLREMLDEAGVDVRFGSELTAVRTSAHGIDCIGLAGAHDLCAGTFVDASYTGDLVLGAGVPHRLGMADFRSYDETLPAERDWAETVRVAPGDETEASTAFAANPFVTTLDDVPAYADAFGDGTPSLAYRLCVTDDAANRVPFRPGEGYADLVPSFRILARGLDGTIVHRSNGTLVSDIFQLAVIPGGKYDLNAGWARLTNLPAPAGYFGDPAVRADADRTLRAYVESLFYFLGRDPSVPEALRTTFSPFGLCADEFAENGGWPLEAYVREGPRIEGRYTFTEDDIYRSREKATAVALGSYDIDVKPGRILFADGRLVSDADMLYTAPAYEIPFEVMVPAGDSVTNLLAPIALSASPTAYGSLRMEPQYVALGEAAGIAAALASRDDRAVASVPVADVQALLRYDGVLFTVRELCRTTPVEWRATGGYDPATCAPGAVVPRAVGKG
jgi:hypothetical protein